MKKDENNTHPDTQLYSPRERTPQEIQEDKEIDQFMVQYIKSHLPRHLASRKWAYQKMKEARKEKNQ